MASVALTIFAEQLLYELGITPHLLFVAVITIDEHKQVGSAEFYLCALMVARGRAHATLRITVYRQSLDIDHATADTLVGLPCPTDAQCQGVAMKFIRIKTAEPLVYDPYRKNRVMGSLVFIDDNNDTVGAAMIR